MLYESVLLGQTSKGGGRGFDSLPRVVFVFGCEVGLGVVEERGEEVYIKS